MTGVQTCALPIWCVVKSCLPIVASGLGLRLYLEKHLRERERERERERDKEA